MYVIKDEGSMASGLFSALGLYMLQGAIFLSFINLIPFERFVLTFFALGLPLTQFLYIVPFYVERKNRERTATSSGLLAGALVAALLHLAVFGWIGFDLVFNRG